MSKTLTWYAPQEPGPEVTHVRDRHGNLYERRAFGNGDVAYKPEGGIILIGWGQLLCERGPITNATGEVR